MQGTVVLMQVEGPHLRFLKEGCKMVSGQYQGRSPKPPKYSGRLVSMISHLPGYQGEG